MIKRILALSLSLIMVVTLFSGCSLFKNAEFNIGFINEIESLDPLKAIGDAETISAVNCFEGLLKFNQNGEIVLSGATKYSISGDGLTYTFSLNPKAIWYVAELNEGILGETDFDNRVTAHDYVYSIKKVIAEKLKGYENYSYIRGVEEYYEGVGDLDSILVTALDDLTLEIILVEPHSEILSTLAESSGAPSSEKFASLVEGVYGTTASSVICNGPYYIAECNKGKSLVLKRNPKYKGRTKAENAQINLSLEKKQKNVVEKYASNSYDILLTDSANRIENPNGKITPVTNTVWGIVSNCSKDIMKNENLRKALLSSIDYSVISTPKFATGIATGVVAPDYLVTERHYSKYTVDNVGFDTSVDKASEYMILASTQIKEAVNLNVYVPTTLENSMNIICDGWADLFGSNIKTNIVTFDIDEYETVIEENEYHIAILPIHSTSSTAVSVLRSISSAPCNFTDNSYESLLRAAEISLKEQQKATAINECEKYIVSSGVVVPLYLASTDLYLNDGVTGIYNTTTKNAIYFNLGDKKSEG
ncbi:MAG: hypothetical protein J6V78_02360 [Clostridia bacterium]|nr:hypothetical protein [Clostridia bacterium]